MRSLFFPVAMVVALLAGCGKGGDDTSVAANLPPQADAGPDVTQPADQAVTLDGRASFDPEGTALTYHWSFDSVPEGSTLTDKVAPFVPNKDTSGITTFHPDKVGVYVVKLEVDDGAHLSDPSYAVVTTTAPDQLPVADAGPDATVGLGDTVSLDGSGSYDPLGGSLGYAWQLVNVPYNSHLSQSDLSGADTKTPSFEPDVTGDYTATLVVTNGMTSSEPDSVEIHVEGANEPPVANAGDDIDGEDCTNYTLDCSSSTDPEGNRLEYFWELQSKPSNSQTSNASFADRTTATTDFYPDQAGKYVISCSVFDGQSWSAPDLLTITAAERASNKPPIANAGADRTESVGDATCVADGYTYDCAKCDTLKVDVGADGEASDPDGDPIVVTWEITTTSTKTKLVSTTDFPTQAILGQTSPTEPGACVDTPTDFSLTVQDCPGAVSTDKVTIKAECCGVEGS